MVEVKAIQDAIKHIEGIKGKNVAVKVIIADGNNFSTFQTEDIFNVKKRKVVKGFS